MKKTFIIALCCMALSFAACKPEPTPENVDYTEKYVGHYIGDFDLTISLVVQPCPVPILNRQLHRQFRFHHPYDEQRTRNQYGFSHG